MLAAAFLHLPVVEYLLEGGADIEAKDWVRVLNIRVILHASHGHL